MPARMRSGWAVIGDTRHLPGYCVLLHDGDADHLTDPGRRERAEFMFDLALLGEAVQHACSDADPGFLRVNYEVLGNPLPLLHGHVHARYAWEPDALRHGPVRRYPDRGEPRFRLDERHDDLRAALTRALERITAETYAEGPGGTRVPR
ncbi:diadenosine tetraphosphate hydrolase [Embleya sp. NPDC127516]|uniref:diadenosine tetraphosphate hydrolase n=1 Tax=Embleya sp. NPDC127516 TaxID=3363990 RepID=UPI003822349C